MKKIIAGIILSAGIATLSGCSEASRVSYNLSEQADNFNDIRQVTVINCITGDVEKYKYTLNFNPKMWIPVEAETID